MTQPSAEQLAIIGAPITPLAVIACAGSGKTFTAVRRLAHLRRQLGDHRGRVALLSFSNVAVDTFRTEYRRLSQAVSAGAASNRVEIDTLDAFITSNVLRPHAYRTMGCQRVPFLVDGNEPFLQNKDFKFWAQPTGSAAFPVNPNDLHKVVVNVQADQPTFYLRQHSALLPINNGAAIAARLGALGAYTHDLGRYWCYCTLSRQTAILKALARRYPHILIDEAQDIGTLHEAIVEQLVNAGCQVSLIGDPNQGIYDFAGANGSFLTRYGQRAGVNKLGLTKNRRSVQPIVDLANSLSARTDAADRPATNPAHGAFFVAYRNAEKERLLAAFQTAVAAADLDLDRSAVLCRARDMADQLAGNQGAPGTGAVKGLAQAAILRDRNKNYLSAFKLVAGCVVSLLANPPQGLVARLIQPARYPNDRSLRRLVWAFTRDAESGLPASALTADTHWHPLLLQRMRALLAAIQIDHGLAGTTSLGNRLSKRDLPNAPLDAAAAVAVNDQPAPVRVDTVHQAKGESLDAVLYLANKDHASRLLAGVDTEVGRIGYVAATRARNLLWLGVPANSLDDLRPALLARGFREVGTTAAD